MFHSDLAYEAMVDMDQGDWPPLITELFPGIWTVGDCAGTCY